MTPVKIAFFGSSLVSAYWNGAATYYRGILSALYATGAYQITFYEPNAYERQEHRDLPTDPEYARVVVYPATEADARACLADAAKWADVLIKASGVGVFDTLLEAEILTVRKPYQSVLFWDVDAPATLDRVHQNAGDSFRALIAQYDGILTYGGGPPVVNAYLELGAKKCVPIYNALDTTTHFPVPPDPRFACDLAFLGNRLPDREARVHDFFFHAADLSPQKTFLLGGSGWDANHLPANVRYAGHVGTNDHNAWNASARAVLNISRESMARYGFSPATRVFEAAGSGACLLTDYWEGIGEFFEPGVEIQPVHDGAEVAAVLSDLTPEKAHAIGQAALRRVRQQHTYAHRAALLDEVLRAR